MRLGIDFDNTIVRYDELFHRVALEQGWIPAELPANKSEVRNHLRRLGREDVWTEMQGRVYGARMLEATPYPGVIDFFRACRRAAIPVFIVSHKTKRPFLGEPHDLHQAALDWLTARGFLDESDFGLRRESVFFELTKDAKLARIASLGCTHFVDDLPEFLAEPGFPAGVERLLFDPNRLYHAETRFRRLEGWPEITSFLGLAGAGGASRPDSASPAPEPDRPSPSQTLLQVEQSFVGRCLERLGERRETGGAGKCGGGEEAVSTSTSTSSSGSTRFAARPLPGGANNRVWHIAAGGEAFVLKRYFHSAADPRDRFGAERAFYRWAWDHGLRRTPEPLDWDATERLALFRFVDGRKLLPAEVGQDPVDQAIAFVVELNADRATAADAPVPIPAASESCFALAEHLACVDRRLERLRHLEPGSAVGREAAAFVTDELTPAWTALRSRIERTSPAPLDRILEPSRRCLSPSDFGFHNALLGGDGVLRFFDFEYAGWDDPAKLVCDFFCQPQVPVPAAHWDRVVDTLDDALALEGSLADRARRLLPVYRLKWCCILLNEFLRDSKARREFARGGGDIADRQRTQLAKARAMLARNG